MSGLSERRIKVSILIDLSDYTLALISVTILPQEIGLSSKNIDRNNHEGGIVISQRPQAAVALIYKTSEMKY